MTPVRRTKIVCTIGPSTKDYESIVNLLLHGMNVARINCSHGTHEVHANSINFIRKAARENNYSIPVLMDLQGPKIRVGHMKDGMQKLEDGSIITITGEDILGTSSLIPIDYEKLVDEAEIGNIILLDDGLLEFKVIGKNGKNLEAKVIVGGYLKSRKGVNLPNVKISIPALTEKDLIDLEFAVEQDADYVALSFVRTADEVYDLKKRLEALGSLAKVVSKIEKPEAIDNIDEIIAASDAIMVARGDLGIEIANEEVPVIQKMIIQKCRKIGIPVITATQMLDSMINNPRPTRAESSDVANAVLDGTDAVMLSGETAAGKYPMDAVNVMDRICRKVEERSPHLYNSLEYTNPNDYEKQIIESISHSCIFLADNVGAKVISTITHSGSTARRVAKFRPRVPIFAFTESQKIRRQLNLVWGVRSVRLDQLFDTDQSVQLMKNYLKDNGQVKAGDRVVIATGIPTAKRGHTNMMTVSTIE